MPSWMRTLRRAVEFAGVGLHSGQHVRVRVAPGAQEAGIRFLYGGDEESARPPIHAHVSNVDSSKSQLCTQLRAEDGSWSVSTIEHLMAALTAARITSANVEILESNGGNVVEVPILDGSAEPFAQKIAQVGVTDVLDAPLQYLRVKQPVQVVHEDKAAWLLPMPSVSGRTQQETPVLNLSVQVNFEHKGLGTRFCRFILDHDPDANLKQFLQHVAPARTFTFEEEIEWMRAHGLALGGSLENAIVFKEAQRLRDDPSAAFEVLNEEGLRFPDDEWVRHKMLDCIGDLGLLGMPLHGYFFATSPGHALSHRLVEELLRDARNYEITST
ncbi:hypothetical protein Poli38472_004804 [Pythium oligandrum]|uniref:UDP-3-O-acyl-N-acetylglucosamine deacetylase n=1 Tax=Pythium oligandrum TaxID=41045 RepID=A0A8K1CBG2_PYTOL|nr:hypothetical protein Poli38472_004804 [Pythium oligandrum]|eukprot:TMW59735.1 hypothetical protein Poli38472_004804 [Pythium oligandrum]